MLTLLIVCSHHSFVRSHHSLICSHCSLILVLHYGLHLRAYSLTYFLTHSITSRFHTVSTHCATPNAGHDTVTGITSVNVTPAPAVVGVDPTTTATTPCPPGGVGVGVGPVPSSSSSSHKSAHQTFVVKPFPNPNLKPLLVFINPKSG